MLQRKAGIHRPQAAENSGMKITNLHILMRDSGIAHARTIPLPLCGSSTPTEQPPMERSTMLGSRLAFSEYHEQIGALCAVGVGSLSAGGQRHRPLRCGCIGLETAGCH